MVVAIVGSRNLCIDDFSSYLPAETSEIVSGGAKGIDTCAEEYAKKNKIEFTVIKPDYKRYGKGAPIVRNKEIVAKSDMIIAFWDGKSRGTAFVIEECKRKNKRYRVLLQ